MAGSTVFENLEVRLDRSNPALPGRDREEFFRRQRTSLVPLQSLPQLRAEFAEKVAKKAAGVTASDDCIAGSTGS